MRPIRYCLLAALVASMALAFATPAAAQVFVYGYNDCAASQGRSFNSFLYDHPGIRADLYGSSYLLNDPWYLSRHPELSEFLWNHQCFRRQELVDPGRAFLYGPAYRAPYWGYRSYSNWGWRGDDDDGGWSWRYRDRDWDRDPDRGWYRRHDDGRDHDRGQGWQGQSGRDHDRDAGRGGQPRGGSDRGRDRR